MVGTTSSFVRNANHAAATKKSPAGPNVARAVQPKSSGGTQTSNARNTALANGRNRKTTPTPNATPKTNPHNALAVEIVRKVMQDHSNTLYLLLSPSNRPPCVLLLFFLPEEITLSDDTVCNLSGCEYDYSSNTYRLMVTLTAGPATVGENFIIVKVDGATGYPKVLSVK